MTDEEKEKHERLKRKLKIIGAVLLVIGIVCEVTGFINFFAVFNSGGGMPDLFFLCFLGAPCIFAGVAMLAFGLHREILQYGKNETVPVINEAADELSPAIKSVVKAVRDGVKEDGGAGKELPAEDEKKGCVCPSCGSLNQPENKFCDKCGAKLFKICPACGARQDGDDVFCGECGEKLD